MGKNKNVRKRLLDTSSGTSYMDDLSINKSITEEKLDVKHKSDTQHGTQEFRPTSSGTGTISLRTVPNEGNAFCDSDENVSTLSYNSSGNLCTSNVTEEKCFESYFESLARRRSQSLEGRPRWTNGPNSPLITKTNRLIKEDFLKISRRRLEDQRCGNDRKDSVKQSQEQKRNTEQKAAEKAKYDRKKMERIISKNKKKSEINSTITLRGQCKRQLDTSSSSSSSQSVSYSESPIHSTKNSAPILTADTEMSEIEEGQLADSEAEDLSHLSYSSPENPHRPKADLMEQKYYQTFEKKRPQTANDDHKKEKLKKNEDFMNTIYTSHPDVSLTNGKKYRQVKKKTKLGDYFKSNDVDVDRLNMYQKKDGDVNGNAKAPQNISITDGNDDLHEHVSIGVQNNTVHDNVNIQDTPLGDDDDLHKHVGFGVRNNAIHDNGNTQDMPLGDGHDDLHKHVDDGVRKSAMHKLVNSQGTPIGIHDDGLHEHVDVGVQNGTMHNIVNSQSVPIGDGNDDLHEHVTVGVDLHKHVTVGDDLHENVGIGVRNGTMHTFVNTKTSTILKDTALKTNQSRHIMTEQQMASQREINLRTVFVTGEGDQLIKLYKHKPRLLNKEIIEQAGGQVDKVYLTKNGALRIVTFNYVQKDKMMKLNHLDNNPVKTSLPYILTKAKHNIIKPVPSNKQNADYLVKGVIYGLFEEQSILNEIAKDIGATQMYVLGNYESSNATMVAYNKDTILPSTIEINNRKFKVHLFIPKPMRCDRCQRFGHLRFKCTRQIICSYCSGHHDFQNCREFNIQKCANCGQGHSAAYRGCPQYVEIQKALKIRAEENVTLNEAIQKVKLNQTLERNYKELNLNQKQGNNCSTVNNVSIPTYADKLKLSIDSQTWSSSSSSSTTQIKRNDHLETEIPMEESSSQNVVEAFMDFNNQKYYTINKGNVDNNVDPIIYRNKKFVLGILATIDNCKTKEQAKLIISQVASEIMFQNEVQFNYI